MPRQSLLFSVVMSLVVVNLVLAQAPPAAGPASDADLIGPPPIEINPAARPAAAPAPQQGNPLVITPQQGNPAKPGALPAAVQPAGARPQPAGARKVNFAPLLPTGDYSPPILYIDQPRYDFGDVYKGEVINHRYELENRGGSPLVIQEVKASCGCTVVDMMEKVISPGRKGGFELKVETSRLPVGQQQKYADITCNDPKQSKFRVFIQGKIDSILKVEPEAPKIQTVKGVGQGSTEITLTKNAQAELKVLSARSQSGRLLIDLKEKQPGSVWTLLVKTNYGLKDVQNFFTEQLQLEVQVGAERKMVQEILLTVQIKDRIEIAPRSLYFKRTDFQPLRDKGTPVMKTVDIKSILDNHAFQITNLKVEDPDNVFKVTKETVKEGREYRLVVTIDKLPPEPADQKPQVQKSLKGNITITTDDPMMQEVNLRCIAFF